MKVFRQFFCDSPDTVRGRKRKFKSNFLWEKKSFENLIAKLILKYLGLVLTQESGGVMSYRKVIFIKWFRKMLYTFIWNAQMALPPIAFSGVVNTAYIIFVFSPIYVPSIIPLTDSKQN